ncbi:hypothetical protein OLX02_01600 [Novosphingobium sp. KCTC 2891]|uniref:hypothetical protein n=1 Tax=Novosphingobium sp. KCTC 2891 TaxID=2989730 RepID=UPI0022235718|nr:hypothetical protein [Novosphingobium sp. KCTC 2891]MCW1381509.1 hypothetical protein [Novosphingobium sp. KCTC 2891]
MKLRGWNRWQRSRRKELRQVRGIPLNLATFIALNEARCRARIADVIGKKRAETLRLIVCRGFEHGAHSDVQFLIATRLDRRTREELNGIPELLWPIELRP